MKRSGNPPSESEEELTGRKGEQVDTRKGNGPQVDAPEIEEVKEEEEAIRDIAEMEKGKKKEDLQRSKVSLAVYDARRAVRGYIPDATALLPTMGRGFVDRKREGWADRANRPGH
jgi:hypothetical protein